MGDVEDEDLTDFSTDEESFIDVVFEHAHEGFFVRDAQDEGKAGAVANSEMFVLGDWEDHIGEGVVAQSCHSALMDFIADYILIACFCHPDEVNHTIVKSDQNFLGGLVVGDADGLLGVSFGPHLHKFGGL